MDISQCIQHIFPQAIPFVNYILQDDGPTPVLRDGNEGVTRYEIRLLEDGETEEVEGIHYRLVVDFNRLEEGVDYDIVECGPYIATWNLPVPQPTEAELLAAWEELQSLPPVPDPITPEQRITQLEAENAGLALELTQTQIRLDQSEQAQADLLLTLVAGGVL